MLIFTEQIALPDFSAGAMENWGLIMYRESALLYEDGVSSSSDKEWVAIVVAHELAHQVQFFTIYYRCIFMLITLQQDKVQHL